MTNAKEEFLEEVNQDGRNLVCARVGVDRENFGMKIKWFVLNESYTAKEFSDFLDKLDFKYDDGFGSQELYGIILFEDSFSDRGEYDGSEWWSNHKMPTPQEVIAIPKNRL